MHRMISKYALKLPRQSHNALRAPPNPGHVSTSERLETYRDIISLGARNWAGKCFLTHDPRRRRWETVRTHEPAGFTLLCQIAAKHR